jgi:hypothetical protein
MVRVAKHQDFQNSNEPKGKISLIQTVKRFVQKDLNTSLEELGDSSCSRAYSMENKQLLIQKNTNNF